MSAPFCFSDDRDTIGAAQRVGPTGKKQRGDVDMQRLARLVMAVDLGVYCVTEQGPTVTAIVFDVMASIKQFAKAFESFELHGVVCLGPLHAIEYGPIPVRFTAIFDVPRSGARILSFQGLGLERLPDELRSLRQLATLDVSTNRLDYPPDWIGELDGLVSLKLDGSLFSAMPDSISRLTRLSILDLSDNRFESFLECVGANPTTS